MPSKLITDRQKSAKAIAAAAAANAAAASAALGKRFKPLLKRGEDVGDVALIFELCGRECLASAERLAAADAEHERELSDDDAHRRARDEAAQKLYETAIDARDLIASAYGDAGIAALGIQKPAPIDPLVLAAYVTSLIGALRDPNVKLPTPKRASVRIDRKALADELDEHLPKLTQALDAVQREVREAQVTLAKKNQAMAAFDATLAENTDLLMGLLNAAGLHEQADKLKPTRRNKSSEPDATPAPAPADGEKPTG